MFVSNNIAGPTAMNPVSHEWLSVRAGWSPDVSDLEETSVEFAIGQLLVHSAPQSTILIVPPALSGKRHQGGSL